jgi:hypothetical protein
VNEKHRIMHPNKNPARPVDLLIGSVLCFALKPENNDYKKD